MSDRLLVPVLLALSLSVVAAPAWSHKLKVFATAEGTRLVGYAYFIPGGRPRQIKVTVTDADGKVLAATATDDEGHFQIEAKRRVDHHITVGGGDGHVATYTIRAEELPDSLSPSPPIPLSQGEGRERLPLSSSTPLPQVSQASNPSSIAAVSPAVPASNTDWRIFIDQSIARQIRPLREQIDAYQEKIWWHDVLGGIGYILGLGGLAFGLAERRRQRDASPSTVAGRNPS